MEIRKKELPVTLRIITGDDIPSAMRLSQAEKWNQTEKDWGLLVENPLNTCLLAESNKKVIGTATAINYSNEVAWVAMVLVDREFRGMGVSKLLLTDMFRRTECCHIVKLDATPSGQAVYRDFGFKDEYMIHRLENDSFQGPGDHVFMTVPEPILPRDVPEIISLDKRIFGVRRGQLIEHMVMNFPGKAWKIMKNNKLSGFILGRDGSLCHHIGPLMAVSSDDAKDLIAMALKYMVSLPVIMDILDDKKELINWIVSRGFIRQRHFFRMYLRDNPYPGMTANHFLICGPEFG
jgi:GNAT superfamily N-acetyltransferase